MPLSNYGNLFEKNKETSIRKKDHSKKKSNKK